MASILDNSNCQKSCEVLYLGFNQNGSLLSIGTQKGFSIYSIIPFECVYREDCGAISIVEMLFNSDLIALVGSSSGYTTSNRILMLWNSTSRECLATLSFDSPIHAVKMNPKRIVVILDNEIRIYDIKTLKFLHLIKREYFGVHLSALCSLCYSTEKGFLALPCSKDVGMLAIIDTYSLESVDSVLAHRTLLQCLAFNSTGTLLATASTKGTVIRIWSVPSLDKMWSCRRGATECSILYLYFSPTSEYLVSTGSPDTIHIFKLDIPPETRYNLVGATCVDSTVDASNGAFELPHELPSGVSTKGELNDAYNLLSKHKNGSPTTGDPTNNESFDISSFVMIGEAATPSKGISHIPQFYRKRLDSLSEYLPHMYRESVQAFRCFAWIRLRPPSSSVPAVAIINHFENSATCEVVVASYSGCAYIYHYSEVYGRECRLRDEYIFKSKLEASSPTLQLNASKGTA